MGAEKKLIRLNSKVRDEVSLQKVGEKDKQLLTEKIIAKIENKNPYTIRTKRTRDYTI